MRLPVAALADNGEYFLITSNVGSLSTEHLKTDAVSKEELTALLANIAATKKLVVIDTPTPRSPA